MWFFVRAYCLTQLSDAVLLADLAEIVARDHAATAELLAYLCEVEDRRLFRPAGYPSLYIYCVDRLHWSEDMAFKRIQAARVCRRFPQVFMALLEGRLHLAAVCLLAPHLTPGNVDELLASATHQRKWEVERLLAARFPRTERMTLVEVYAARAGPACSSLPAPGQVESYKEVVASEGAAEQSAREVEAVAREPAVEAAPDPEPARSGPALSGASAAPRAPDPRPVVPLATQRFALQVTLAQSTYDKLRHALALLSHVVPEHDVAQVLDRALDLLIRHLERQKIGAPGPRASRKAVTGRRYIPKSVRRAVWERDGGRCTFVGETGHRCEERRFLEFDHVDPVALGGVATVEKVRLRCRAHNQYEAERVFGARFMNERRQREGRAG